MEIKRPSRANNAKEGEWVWFAWDDAGVGDDDNERGALAAIARSIHGSGSLLFGLDPGRKQTRYKEAHIYQVAVEGLQRLDLDVWLAVDQAMMSSSLAVRHMRKRCRADCYCVAYNKYVLELI